MIYKTNFHQFFAVFIFIFLTSCTGKTSNQNWTITEQGYLERQGLSVLAFHNYYPVGNQGGIEIIQHGERIATNGFIHMQQVKGQRFNDPEQAIREINKKTREIKATVNYDKFDFKYTIRIWPEGDNFRLAVDLNKPIPIDWENKLSFEIGIFPDLYYGKSFKLGESFGIIPRQAMGPVVKDQDGNLKSADIGHGKILTLAEEDPLRRIVIVAHKGELVMVDERNSGNLEGGDKVKDVIPSEGLIQVKTTIPTGLTDNAIEWTIKPNTIQGWKRDPVIAISQVGYHPDQIKKAIIELDQRDNRLEKARLISVSGDKGQHEVLSAIPYKWGKFLSYNYAIFDFSSIKEPGMYIVSYGDKSSYPFSIDKNVYKKDVWQPTLESFFPIQMCHVLVRDGHAIWHGACHLDDALQAPLNIEHTDGYRQYEKTETKYTSLTTVPYLNQGGWHDAGDDDLAAGSQAATTEYLVLANEICKDQPDETYVNYKDKYIEMRRPDGVPDFVQQIKHGVLNLLSGYRVSGHSFAGIIANFKERGITGDWASQTDQLFYDSKLGHGQKTLTSSGIMDDRWVFTNKDTGLEYEVSAALASASRSLRGYDDKLAFECLETAKKTWDYEQTHEPVSKPNAYVPGNIKLQEILATAELLYTTRDAKYVSRLVSLLPDIRKNIGRAAWCVARVSDQLKDEEFNTGFMDALKTYKVKLDSTLATNPFSVEWNPEIWGIGWNIQDLAVEHYYLAMKYPDLFNRELILSVVNYVLGCHPGSNTSLVSGVGAHSITSAFGVYRHMESYIAGGMISGTALIRPDFPELKEGTPWLWQQTEYVMPGAATYIFCVLAADKLLNMQE
jgi:endoglucanase